MLEHVAETSPRLKARMAGVFQGLEGLTFTFGQVIVLGKLVVFHDAAATAANILGHQPLFRLGFASCVMGVGFHTVWGFLFYELFKVVNRRLSLLAAFVVLVACAVQAVTTLLYIAPLSILTDGPSMSAFSVPQLQMLALLFFRLNGYAFDIYLIFFGLWCVLIGYLIFRSAFLPRILGVLLAIDGLGWMLYLSPPLAAHLFPLIATAAGLAEIPLEFWLIVAGVNAQRWREQAAMMPK
jgi:hypothetical protein